MIKAKTPKAALKSGILNLSVLYLKYLTNQVVYSFFGFWARV